MGKAEVSVMIIPPEHLVDIIVPDAMKAHLENLFPGYSFAIDTTQSLPGDYYGFVQLSGYEGDSGSPTMDDYAQITAVLRAYGDGRDKLH